MATTPVERDHLIQFSASNVDLIIGSTPHGLPWVEYWGPTLGRLDEAQLSSLLETRGGAPMPGSTDTPERIPLVAQQSQGWVDKPGLLGSRAGKAFSPCLRQVTEEVRGRRFDFEARDSDATLALTGTIELTREGLVRARVEVRNDAPEPYQLDALQMTLPLPAKESEVIDQTGRWNRERSLQRHPLTVGVHTQEMWGARQLKASIVHGTCAPGSGWREGSVHLAHLAWSGNVRSEVVRNPEGQTYLRAGELLYPGEVRLIHGGTYSTPWLNASSGEGFDETAGRFHAFVRGLASHPSSPRPVTLNSWEAVYFDHSYEKLVALAERAADVGIERFVLDDGWFSSRRGDNSGLGDWWVSEDVWPEGLTPLIDRVHALGMQFGLWIEPEMVNANSDLARAHPEWILAPQGRLPAEVRHQQVLDLAIPEAWEEIRQQIVGLVEANPIDYLKWDSNRDLTEAGDQVTGTPAFHAQMEAVYSLMDAVRNARPGLEIESCASGGGRIDLEVMTHAQRVWGSDCLDPLERLSIHDGTDLLLPPEVVGSHVGAGIAHSTARESSLDFRAITALPYHFGVEWDLTQASPGDVERLTEWIAYHKDNRSLLHTGALVHETARGLALRGVVAASGDRAIYAVSAPVATSDSGFVRMPLPGLDPDACYLVSPAGPRPSPRAARLWPGWWNANPARANGAFLGSVGLPMPRLNPQQAVVLEARRANPR